MYDNWCWFMKGVVVKSLFRMTWTFFIFVFLVVSKLNSASAGHTIAWYYPDFAPTNIVSGPHKDQDVLFRMYGQVFPYLSDYTHTTSVANFRRTIQAIEAKQNVCAMALLKTEARSKVVDYSIEHFLVHPVRIIIRKPMLTLLSPYRLANGNYSLEEILKDGKLTLGYSLGRSYSDQLDRLLKQHTTDKNSLVSAQNPILAGLMKMLLRHRFDYTLGYAHEAAFIMESIGSKEEIISLPIEGATDFIPVHVGCPKNDWGRTIIKKLDPYLKKIRLSPDFYGGYLRWLDPETRAKYIQEIKAYFSKK